MSAARSVTAHFVVIPTYVLTTFAAPPAGGTVSGGGAYNEGTAVTVTATANSGYAFDRWLGACTGSDACSVTMSANRSVTARFVRTYVLTTSASPSGGGSGLRRRHVQLRDRRHGHGHGEQRLPLRPLVRRLHGHGRLFPWP